MVLGEIMCIVISYTYRKYLCFRPETKLSYLIIIIGNDNCGIAGLSLPIKAGTEGLNSVKYTK